MQRSKMRRTWVFEVSHPPLSDPEVSWSKASRRVDITIGNVILHSRPWIDLELSVLNDAERLDRLVE